MLLPFACSRRTRAIVSTVSILAWPPCRPTQGGSLPDHEVAGFLDADHPRNWPTVPCRRTKKASVHTLRHTFATHQIHNGLKINQLKDVLGHKKMETTYKYVHLDRTNLRREMEAGAL